MLKFLFFIILLYFIFVAVRNLARAVIADSYEARRIQQERAQYYQPPRSSSESYQKTATPPRPKTTIHIRQQPVRRVHWDENVEDAKFTDL